VIGFTTFGSGLPANAHNQSGILDALGIDRRFGPYGDTTDIMKDGDFGDTINNCDTNSSCSSKQSPVVNSESHRLKAMQHS